MDAVVDLPVARAREAHDRAVSFGLAIMATGIMVSLLGWTVAGVLTFMTRDIMGMLRFDTGCIVVTLLLVALALYVLRRSALILERRLGA